MPKLPILDRTRYIARNPDGTLRELDWALVNTSLGAMAEPVTQNWVDNNGNLQPLDVLDQASFNRILEVDEALMYSMLGTYGGIVAEQQNNNPLP
jgi:hypothetical protein